MDSRFRYEVRHVVIKCRNAQELLRTLRALGACSKHGEAGETSNCYCMYLSDFPILHDYLLGPIFQGQNQPPLFTPFNRVIMVYSILYISSPTRSRMTLMHCSLSSIIKSSC